MRKQSMERRRGVRLFVLFAVGFVVGVVLHSVTDGAVWAFPVGNLAVFGLGTPWVVRQQAQVGQLSSRELEQLAEASDGRKARGWH